MLSEASLAFVEGMTGMGAPGDFQVLVEGGLRVGGLGTGMCCL